MDRFIIVDSHNSEYIGIIFHILRKCGYNMALTKRLFHWIPSYSKRNIRRDCQTKTVVLVWNEELNDYTSTFQMYKNSDSSLYIRKIATLGTLTDELHIIEITDRRRLFPHYD